MKKGAIFDMDGTMFDTERLYRETWDATAIEMGQALSPTFWSDVGGTGGEEMKTVIRRHYPALDVEAYIAAGMKKLWEAEETCVPEKPGLRKILEFFRSSGVKMAVASSSPQEMIEHNLLVAGIEGYFDAVISGDQMARGKPAPDIFLYAAGQLGLAPEDCYVFEDSLNGIRAGAAAGCTAIMIPDLVEPMDEILPLAACICARFDEALKMIVEEKV